VLEMQVVEIGLSSCQRHNHYLKVMTKHALASKEDSDDKD